MSSDIEVAEVRRAVLTAVWAHRARMREWEAILDDEASTLAQCSTARTNVRAHRMAMLALREVLDAVREAVRERDAAFGGYREVFG
jgi:hypothetical protein